MKKRICFLLVSLLALCATAQKKNTTRILFGDMDEKWAEYTLRTKSDVGAFTTNYFDTLTVKEMKEAFHKFKDAPMAEKSVYAGFDSVTYGPIGESVVLKSPLDGYSGMKKEKLRTVWAWFGRLNVVQLLKPDGTPEESRTEKLKKTDRKEWLNGEFLSLRSPHPYMGFAVSPLPYMEVYREGTLLARAGLRNGKADFFSSVQRTQQVLDGEWHDFVDGGARALGLLLGMNSAANAGRPEKTFSVLLYEKKGERSSQKTYSLELLSPAEPDEDTQELFKAMKDFVEQIPHGAFLPYYTTDFRLLPGRFYRVTANKCGWLVEDYL